MTAIDVEALEKSIAAKLKEALPNQTVLVFPGKPDDFAKLPPGGGLILVSYSASDYAEPTHRDTMLQLARLVFSVTLQIRDLRGHEGAYPLLGRIREALLGFSPDGSGEGMYISDESLLQIKANVWTWIQNWVFEVSHMV